MLDFLNSSSYAHMHAAAVALKVTAMFNGKYMHESTFSL